MHHTQDEKHTGWYMFVGIVIGLFMYWGVVQAQESDARTASTYKNADLVMTASTLASSQDQYIVVDVRADAHFDNRLIPGAIRMPWKLFRTTDKEKGLASTFTGIAAAEKVLGDHGITPGSNIVLYDSVARDGGATASYVFWILDLLGHEKKSILNGGIDAWVAVGNPVENVPTTLAPVSYSAGLDTINRTTTTTGAFIQERLDDPHYQILDVRSPEEYLGKKGTKGAWDNPLKLGHIPGAYNINYTNAWNSDDEKKLKDPAALANLYTGVDPNRTIIVYCNSGRRGSYTYYILRVLGYPRVRLYEGSWKEWGEPRNHFPVETTPRDLPQSTTAKLNMPSVSSATPRTPSPSSDSETLSGGYVSCGG